MAAGRKGSGFFSACAEAVRNRATQRAFMSFIVGDAAILGAVDCRPLFFFFIASRNSWDFPRFLCF